MCMSGICAIRIATSGLSQSLIHISAETDDGVVEYWIFNKNAFESKKCYEEFKRQVDLIEVDRAFIGIDESNMLKIVTQLQGSTTVIRIPINRIVAIIEKYDGTIKCNDKDIKKLVGGETYV